MIVALLLKLAFVETCEISDSLVILDVIFFLLHSHLALFSNKSVQVIFILFSSFSESSTDLLDFSFSLFKFITQSLKFSLVKIL